LLINVFILILITLSFGKEFIRNRAIDSEIEELQNKAESLSARNLELAKVHRALQTEDFLEHEARVKFGLSKPGETVVIIESDPMTDDSQIVSQNYDMSGESDISEYNEGIANPIKWWYYFFDRNEFKKL
jgi:cell division protein FtsB